MTYINLEGMGRRAAKSEAILGARKQKVKQFGETWWPVLIFFTRFLARYAMNCRRRIEYHSSWGLFVHIYNGKSRHLKVALQKFAGLDYKNEDTSITFGRNLNGVMWVKAIFCPQHFVPLNPDSLVQRVCTYYPPAKAGVLKLRYRIARGSGIIKPSLITFGLGIFGRRSHITQMPCDCLYSLNLPFPPFQSTNRKFSG